MWSCCLNVLQGVTLTELKEGERSSQARQIKDGEGLDERFCLRKCVTDDAGVRIPERMEAAETSASWRQKDEVSEEDECRIQFCPVAAQKYWKLSVIHL